MRKLDWEGLPASKKVGQVCSVVSTQIVSVTHKCNYDSTCNL